VRVEQKRAQAFCHQIKKQPAPMALKWRCGDGGAVYGWRVEMRHSKMLATQ